MRGEGKMLESILTLALPAAFLEFSPAGFFGMVDKYTDNRQRVDSRLVVDEDECL